MSITEIRNPFEFEAATNLPLDRISEVYIEDRNYSRFIESKRNIFLIGERGSGKSMMLLYRSFKLKCKKYTTDKAPIDFQYVGIHVPCNSILYRKKDYELLQDEVIANNISEHYLVLDILYKLADSIQPIESELLSFDKASLVEDFEYLIDDNLKKDDSFFESIKKFAQKQLSKTDRSVQSDFKEEDSYRLYSFASLVLPFIDIISRIDKLKDSHFIFMIDDAHDLNEYQRKKINTWIAYRDHSRFSFKVATAATLNHHYHTDKGGEILEGHDFTSINLEMDFQNSKSPFYKLAKDIIERRLKISNIDVKAEDFFPENPSLAKDLQKCKEELEMKIKAEHPSYSPNQVKDRLYKYYRVEYFRKRDKKANRPPYSGFEVLSHVSTGVIRNLLEPCHRMYDAAISDREEKVALSIPAKIQQDILIEMSDHAWERLRTNLSKEVSNCSQEQAQKVKNLYEQLGQLFRYRLENHKSEPRVLAFTISGLNKELEEKINPILDIARRALFLYVRSGVAKDSGRRETYYVPNRILWLARGLDPVGQHGRVSLKAKDIVAAMDGTKFPTTDNEEAEVKQLVLV